MYEKVDGDTERFLFIKEGNFLWQITSRITERIMSGRGTNSPASSEAGANDRLEATRWRYWDNGQKEGDISVTCIDK